MNWRDQKKRIRRFLRDPDGNIWTDAFLLRSFNDEQRGIQHKTGILEKVQALRVPPMYQMSYMHDWEWQHLDREGKNYQCFHHNHQSGKVCAHRWEMQHIAGLDVGESEYGSAFTHPWEAWYALDSPNKPVPVWFPPDFHKVKFIAWDKEPIPYKPLKEIQSDDPSWMTHSGKVQCYTRLDELSNEFVLYPMPSSPVFDDIEGELNDGMITFTEDDTVNQEYGVLLSRTETTSDGDYGLTIDIIEADDNVLLVYEPIPSDLESSEDESDFPVFIRKYIEYGTLERAYSANTDGKIESLREYWGYRKKIGLEVIRKYKRSRRVDRDYCLTTKGAPGFRTRKEPRLPDGYPAVYR